MAKKPATTTTQEQPTKSAAVRDILATGLTVPKDVVEAVKEKFGIDVPATYVSVIKTKLGKESGAVKATTAARRKTTVQQTLVVEANGRASIVAFVRAAKQLGKSEAIDLINELL